MIEVLPQITPRDTQPPPEEYEPEGTPVAVRAAVIVLAAIALVLGYAAYRLNSAAANAKAQLAQTVSNLDRATADLATASARSAGLELQLAKAKSQAADLGSQLDKAQARQSDLQSKLDKAQADILTQADGAKARETEMQAGFQAKIKSSDDAASGLRKELDQAVGKAEDLKSRLATAQSELTKLHPLAVKLRALPLATSFEKNFWDRGFTMHVTSLSPDPLKVKISIAGMGTASASSATLEGGGSLNIENLAAGAKVVIESAGYDALSAAPQ